MLGMKAMSDIPSTQFVPDGENTWMLNNVVVLSKITDTLIESFVSLSYNSSVTQATDVGSDHVLLYAKQVLSLGCLYMEFRDAIREGDGDRVLHCYRYLLPIFQNSGRKIYSIETFNLLFHHDFILTEHQAEELIWSRFINTHGCPGRKTNKDLHCEHLNRLCKTAVEGLGSNKVDESISRVAKALGILAPVLENYDHDNCIDNHQTIHREPSSKKDLTMLITELQKVSLFSEIPNRFYSTFKNLKNNIIHAKPMSETLEWITQHLMNILLDTLP